MQTKRLRDSTVPRTGSRTGPRRRRLTIQAGRSSRRALVESLVKLNPRTLMKNPVVFVVEVVSVVLSIRIVTDLVEQRAGGVRHGDRDRACGSRCSSRTSPRRWPRDGEGAGGRAPQDQGRPDRPPPAVRRLGRERCPGAKLQGRRPS